MVRLGDYTLRTDPSPEAVDKLTLGRPSGLLLITVCSGCSVREAMANRGDRMTNIRPFFFLLVAMSVLGGLACETNQPVATPTSRAPVIPQILRSASTSSVPTPIAIATMASTPTILPIASSGVFDMKWGTEGSGDGQFYGPGTVAVASDGSVYVADVGN